MASAQRIHVVVLFGGQSAEHDVSCVTAAHVIKALDSSKYDITAVGITREGKWVVAQPQADVLVAEGEPTSITPIVEQARGDARTVIFPLLHGPLGEDGTIQGVLELANIAYVGTGVLGSAVAMDKGVAKQVLHANGIPQPKYVSLREAHVNEAALLHAADTLGLPVFVKPANMGSSVGVSKAHSIDEMRSAVQHALTYDEWVLIEEAVVGREIEVAVLGNVHARASIPGEIIPGNEFYDYADKYIGDGAQLIVPANLTADEVEAVQHLAIVIFHTLRAEGMARVDFFYEQHGRGFLCNEINTIPGFTPISMYPKLWQASGMSYPALLDELITLALDRFSRRRRNTAH
ncbi:MAG: D-alanine--D-alanine ligase [Actinobacteria bacterium]|nr:D-alanine--D-alanine ligase [Actinomycetota bacterium]